MALPAALPLPPGQGPVAFGVVRGGAVLRWKLGPELISAARPSNHLPDSESTLLPYRGQCDYGVGNDGPDTDRG